MKKVLSLVLVVAMLATMAVFTVSSTATESTASVKTTEYGNTETTVRYFGGEVSYKMLSGLASLTPEKKESKYDDLGVFGNGDASLGELCIDGKISEGEWGDPITTFYSDYAANNIDATGKHIEQIGAENPLFESPSAENTYYYAKNSAPLAGLYFKLYMMWDEDYFYVAVETNDPDGPKQVNTGASLWDGDCLQVRIDTQGVNSAVNGEKFDATKKTSHTNVSGDKVADYATPWAGIEYREWGDYSNVKYERVPNFMFSYTSAAGGGTEAYDASTRFNPKEETYNGTNQNGDIVEMKRTVYSGRDISANAEDEEIYDNPCLATVRWDNYGTSTNRDDRAVYEVAIPWYLIQASDTEEFTPEDGSVLGMSVALLDAAKVNTPAGVATDGFTSWLAWGSGICGSQITNDPKTTGGNNKIVLSSESYTEYKACDHEFAAATCLAPETCSKCGYQRGYAAGHTNEFSDVVLPTETQDGSIVSTCTVCKNTYTTTIGYDRNDVYDQFNENTPSVINDTHFGSGFTVNWYDSPAPTGDDPDTRKMLYRTDGTSKTAYDNTTFGYSVVDCATRGDGLLYSDLTAATLDSKVNFETQTGTYFDWYNNSANFKNDNSYSYNMEVYLPELDYAYGSDDYTHLFAFFFGGPRRTTSSAGIRYYAGLFSLDNNQTYAFAIVDASVISKVNDSETFKSYALAYNEVSKSSIKTGQWINYNFLFDNNNGVALLFWDGKLVCAAEDSHLKTNEDMTFALFRRFAFPFYAKNIKIGSMGYAAANYTLNTSGETAFSLTVDGQTTQKVAGETVDISAVAFKEGYRFVGWEGDTDLLTSNTADTSFTMPAKDVTLTPKYVLVGDANGDGKINAQDANYLSQIIVGSVASVVPADINNDDKVNATDSNMLTKMITGTYAPIA